MALGASTEVRLQWELASDQVPSCSRFHRSGPYAIAFDSSNNVYLVDFTRHKVVSYGWTTAVEPASWGRLKVLYKDATR